MDEWREVVFAKILLQSSNVVFLYYIEDFVFEKVNGGIH